MGSVAVSGGVGGGGDGGCRVMGSQRTVCGVWSEFGGGVSGSGSVMGHQWPVCSV